MNWLCFCANVDFLQSDVDATIDMDAKAMLVEV